ncbi:hypothetical protein RclHR1_01570010 [Rhizophagus clarus]|uniref:Uncharacterized protein n=1 Tax=Rhizophagus clarus TaxID=94130 RepID=A0A2Z6R8J6_9GLOM|nr:hypothetical protein RclHR1_01570010 [Rhizophagus clarus]GES80898.1 hypothetical protein GLOIN_2v1765962 [Rhizophagus clarus]
MSNSPQISQSWYFTFHTWISSHYNHDHQSLQFLNQYSTLLIELQRKKYEFTIEFHNLIQKQVDEMTKFSQENELYFKTKQDKIIKFKDIQFNELLKFILIEIKDQIEFGEKLRIERFIKEELRVDGKERNKILNDDELFVALDDEFDDDDDDDTFKDRRRFTLTSIYSRDSTSSSSARSSLSIFSINFSSRLQFYPKRTFDYLNDYEDNLYKLILKKQLEIIYDVGDIVKNIESLKLLLLEHDPFSKNDASLFLIIIYSTYQLLEKLMKFDITTNFDNNDNDELIIDLIYNLEIFMKRIKCITLDLVNRNYYSDDDDESDKMKFDKMNILKFFLYSSIVIIFQLHFLSLFVVVCSPY